MTANHARDEKANADQQSQRLGSNSGAGPPLAFEALLGGAAVGPAVCEVDGAFALADRRCRVVIPSARDLFFRARLHREAGRIEAARRDLDAAAALDPTDFAINRAVLAWGEGSPRVAAAERIVARIATAAALRREALDVLFPAGARFSHGLGRTPRGVSGWIAWSGNEALRIEIPGAPEVPSFVVEPDPDHPLASMETSAAQFAIEGSAAEVFRLDFAFADGIVERVYPIAPLRSGGRTDATQRPAASPRGERHLTIVVPVYEDYEATRACLESLARAPPVIAHRIIVVDDASPNEAVKTYLDEAAARGAFQLERNSVNLGFAATVNSALSLRTHGDVLLLNADALLPPGAIDRLAALSRLSADIGTVTPFSNNGELTSYPERNVANPLPLATEVADLDALARAANGDALIDLPNGVGFCLYISEACLDAVKGLSEIYAQGYYEDVEFCLAARESGFRNVAAPGVFVGHAGSKSFGARKRALVMRNLELIEARFPGYKLETAAFVEIDPLAPYRAGLDVLTPPEGPVILVACGPNSARGLGRRRAERLRSEAPQTQILRLETARGRTARMISQGGGSPQTLSFDFDAVAGREAFSAYLGKLEVRRIELVDPASLPEPALSALLGLDAEVALLCGNLAWFSTLITPPEVTCPTLDVAQPCETCRGLASSRQDDAERGEARRLLLSRALERARRVIPLDRLAETFARRVFKARTGAVEPLALSGDGERVAMRGPCATTLRLGVFCPHPSPSIDRLLLRIARRLVALDVKASLTVFGVCVDDAALMATGKAFVTGPARATEYIEMTRHYEVGALLAPDRGGGFGDIEGVAEATGSPKAYFDWSFGAFAPDASDLSLDPRICEDKAAARIVAWMSMGRQIEA